MPDGNPNMIVRLWGGLGNQMFCYAFGRSVSLARGERDYYEKHDIGKDCARAYGLNAFNCEPLVAVQPYGREWREKQFYFDPDVYKAPAGSHFIGHWQTEKYFNEEVIRREFDNREPLSAESQKIAEQIRSGPSCAIHVRRGDYLHPATQAFHGCMDLDWYDRAISFLERKHLGLHYFVFSDDPFWCRSAFLPNGFFTVVDHNGKGKEHEDLILMALCDHAIIPNSTFGWWGAWLGDRKPNRIVIAPKRWFVSEQHDTRDIVPARWVKL